MINKKFNDIKLAICKIQDYISKIEFSQLDDIQRFGILHLLQVVGEAANLVSEDLKSKYNVIRWREIIAFRNFVVHQYMDIKWEIVEHILKNDLGILKTQINEIKFDQ